MSKIVVQITEDGKNGGFVARALGRSVVIETGAWQELRARVRKAVFRPVVEGRLPAAIRALTPCRIEP